MDTIKAYIHNIYLISKTMIEAKAWLRAWLQIKDSDNCCCSTVVVVPLISFL